ncbi:MAG TPA: MerR family transcriptional regulator [Pseudonocardiaceae bacterium]|nr:MerR family transcriptional regulator [Pseudonocardiaceae bacterium]
MSSPSPDGVSKLNDDDYPAYTIGRAADLLDVQPAFLRSLDSSGMLSPERSAGGQRRYSRTELALADRVRALLDQNMPLAAAIRIVDLEEELARAYRRIASLQNPDGQPDPVP